MRRASLRGFLGKGIRFLSGPEVEPEPIRRLIAVLLTFRGFSPCRADPKQKLFFRFNCIYGQDFPVDGLYSYVQVEFNVGRCSISTTPQKIADSGVFPFLQVASNAAQPPRSPRAQPSCTFYPLVC